MLSARANFDPLASRPCGHAHDSLACVTVEQLLQWAYAREKVHKARAFGMPGLPLSPPRAPGDSTLAIGGGAMGGGANLGFEAPADAYAVAGAVRNLQPHAAALIFEYALIGERPEWTPQPRVYIEPGATGRALHFDRTGKRYFCTFRLYSYRGDLPEIVAARRRRYRVWASAVTSVHAALSKPGVLAVHRLAQDLPPLAPWA